jgi:hypothetical protein
MLWYSDVDNIARGEIAIAGTSANYDDPSNDPAHADKWDAQRDIRASLIRWLCSDPEATPRVDPDGIRVIGARMVGLLNLSNIRTQFPIALRKSAIPGRTLLTGAHLNSLDLSGSYIGEISGHGLNADRDVIFADGFHASGEVNLNNAKVGVFINFTGGHFRHSAVPIDPLEAGGDVALSLVNLSVGGGIDMCTGFESDGMVSCDNVRIGMDLHLYGGSFHNPGKEAFRAEAATIEGDVLLNFYYDHPAHINGIVQFNAARINSNFFAERVKFNGASKEIHGLSLGGATIRGALELVDDEFPNGAVLDLSGTTVGTVIDSERAWPMPGKLLLDGFVYSGFYAGGVNSLFPASPTGASIRLRWLRLQPFYTPQPYRQLAKVLRERGDDQGAVTVLIAKDDARYSQYGIGGRLMGGFLKWTIGYGHRPLLAVLWSLAVVLLGSVVVMAGKRAGVMRLTWPETTPLPVGEPTAQLYSLLYSLDAFLPFVNLHQEHYWWPDAEAKGETAIFGYRLNVRGSLVLYYLWLQIIAGWLLSAIFIAGVTGLIRND